MNNLVNGKSRILALAVFALVALILLAGSLNSLDFNPAQPIGGPAKPVEDIKLPPVGRMIAQAAQVPFWEQLAFWALLFVLVLFISMLLSPELRKKLIQTFLRVAIFVLVFLYLVEKNPEAFAGLLSIGQGFENIVAPEIINETPAQVFQPPQVSSFLSYIVAFAVILILIVSAWLLNRWWAAQKAKFANQEPLQEIAAIARASLKEIHAGKDTQNAIIKCYERMSAVVGDKRGLAREQAMTASEFALRLQRAGLPREPIQTLTLLFESARYGGYQAGARDVDEAVSSLNAILRSCGEAV